MLPGKASTAIDPIHKRPDRELVVAKRKDEDTKWIGKYLPDWSSSIYVVDDSKADLTVPGNKGRETMVYLTCVSCTLFLRIWL